MNIGTISGVLAATIAFTATTAATQTLSGASSYRIGGSILGVQRLDSAAAGISPGMATSTVRKELCGWFLRKSACLAKVELRSAMPSGSKMRFELGNRTVLSRTVNSGTSAALPQTIVNVFDKAPTAEIDFGAFGVRVSGNFGGGGQFSARWDTGGSIAAPYAHLFGAAQTWGQGTGTASASVLWGTGKASLDLALAAFNSTVRIEGLASKKDLQRSNAWWELISWSAKLKAKLKLLGVTLASGTVIDVKGDGKSEQWF